jgi:hypothetical protein
MVRGLNYMATDGINSSRVFTNRSVIEDKFQVRREKIANVSGTAAFALAQSLYINPGNSVLFPIFSQIAVTYEEYRVNKLVFTFETDAYTAVNGTASAGKVILATNFDPDDALFSSDTQMENYWHSVKGPPYAPVIQHDALAARRGIRRGDFALQNYFVYPSANVAAPGSGDQAKFYDVGLFQLATSGNAVTSEIGELYVTYSFTMIRPKQPEAGSAAPFAAHFFSIAADATATHRLGDTPYTNLISASGSTLTKIDLDSAPGSQSATTIGLSDTLDNIIALPNSNSTWLLQLAWAGASITAVPTLTMSGGATAIATYHEAGSSYVGKGFFLSGGVYSSVSQVVTTTYDGTPTATTNLVTVGGLTGLATGDVDIYIIKLPTALVTHGERQKSRLARLERQVRLLLNGKDEVKDEYDDVITPPGSSLTDSTVWKITEAVRSAVARK